MPDDATYAVRTVRARSRLRTFRFAWDLRSVDFSGFDVLNAHGDDWFMWGVRRPWHVHTYHGSCLAEALNIRGVKERARMTMLAVCEQQSVLLPDVTVAVSENTRRHIKGIRHVIPCGVDTSRFQPGAPSSKSPEPTVLFVGTMHGRKRGRWLHDVFLREVRVRIPRAQLWCVCERPEDLPEVEGVRFFGRVGEAELIRLYREAWAFCLPSTYEGFGVPYIEAMASGLPVVATRNPGSVEVTRDGKDGWVVGDSTVGETLCRLLEDATARGELSEAGLARSEAFAWDSVCERYEGLYR